jgi:hypothetical protein
MPKSIDFQICTFQNLQLARLQSRHPLLLILLADPVPGLYELRSRNSYSGFLRHDTPIPTSNPTFEPWAHTPSSLAPQPSPPDTSYPTRSDTHIFSLQHAWAHALTPHMRSAAEAPSRKALTTSLPPSLLWQAGRQAGRRPCCVCVTRASKLQVPTHGRLHRSTHSRPPCEVPERVGRGGM